MKPGLLNLFSALSMPLLIAAAQSNAQTPQRDTRPRTASIGGRVTVGGAGAGRTRHDSCANRAQRETDASCN